METIKSQNEKSVKEKYTSVRLLRSGVNVVFRPIECADKERFKRFFMSLSPASIHFRYFEIIKELPNETVEKYCCLDYSEELAIVALPMGEDEIVGVARLEFEAQKRRGEFALTVADAWQGAGLGLELLNYLIKIACDYRLEELHCFVSSDNLKMIALAKKTGLKAKSAEGDILEFSLRLDACDITPMA